MASHSMLDYAYFEGNIVPFAEANVSIATHSLQYGTGAFAGIRGYRADDGETMNVFRLPDHTARLLRSGRLLRSNLPFTPASLAQVIVELVEKNAPTTDIYIRPFIYKPALQLTPRLQGIGDELAVYMMPIGHYLKPDGVKAIVSSWVRIPDNVIPSRGKLTGAYINSAFAKDEAESKGADEAIMLNSQGKVAEGSACNFFMVRDGALVTPPFDADILEGITRRSFFELAKHLGIPVVERPIDRSEIYVAEEAFFCGTGVQLAPIVEVDTRPIGDGVPGPVTSAFAAAYDNILRGRNSDFAHWLTPIRIPVAAR